MKSLLFIISLSITVNILYAFDCHELNVGTIPAPKESANDIIHQGKTSKFWILGSSTPIITVQSKAIQYFYLPATNLKLTRDNIALKYDNELFANSTFVLKDEDKGGFAIEITYNCAEFGGALITYTLDIAIPGCGQGIFSWKKVCGYPLAAKDGLMVEMSHGNFSELVIRNGLRVNNTFWDPEIQNFALGVGPKINKATFKVYMKHDDSVQTDEAHANIDSYLDANNTDHTRRSYVDVYKLFPSTKVSLPEVDSDEDVVTVTVSGSGKEGGTVSNNTSLEVELDFACHRKATSTIEFILPLDYFRDIVLFFVKECPDPSSSIFSSLTFWVIVIGLGILGYLTYKNMVVNGKSGPEALPFYDDVSEFIVKIRANKWQYAPAAQESIDAPISRNNNNTHDNEKNNRDNFGAVDEEDSEFKIENISEIKVNNKNGPPKYGSLS